MIMVLPLQHGSVKLLEQSQLSPPPGSVATTSLPLTFFDISWLLCRHMQRLNFYQLSTSTQNFIHHHLPILKLSLSLTLRHFFPFAGNLISPPSPAHPHILFTDCDSVTLSVYESEADFHRLFAHGPRATEELHPFVPNLPPSRKEGETRVVPLMALQVTIFPEFGICIGVRFSHVAADGRAFNHFMKSWASICKKSTGDSGSIPLGLDESRDAIPSHDRAGIEDPNGLKSIFLDEWWNLASTWDEDAGPPGHSLEHKVRATFVLSQAQIERLKAWTTDQVSNDSDSTSFRASSFVLTCALIWVCLIKSKESDIKNDNDPLYFIFVADCRNRLSKCPIPDNYFGNCLSICFVWLTRKELTGENGMVGAMKVIGKRIEELEKNGPLEGAEKWMVKWKEVAERWKHVTVAGSPRLGAYDPDFGWGKPKKVEFVQIDRSVAFSVAENGNEEGGVEVGVALTSAQMSCFKSLFERNLKAWSK
ncbi:hypothetical protein CsatA_016857 [Cannabis sativa]